MINRSMLRSEAKKLYKEQTKGIPKGRRVPFSKFFKEFKKLKCADQNIESDSPIDEYLDASSSDDVDLDSIISVNDLNE